jgi:putative DNA primase/helicase
MPRYENGPVAETVSETMPEVEVQDMSPDDTLPGRDLTPEHREWLAGKAIKPEVAQGRVRSIVERADMPEDVPASWTGYWPTQVYRWQHDGRVQWQLRIPDNAREEGGPRYLFYPKPEDWPEDQAWIPFNQVRDDGAGPILIIEGSNQHLAAASYVPDEFAVYGMFGCNGWSGQDLSFTIGRPVWVVLDGDLATNRGVYDAATALLDTLSIIGADSVRFAKLPAQPKKQGLDDFLARLPEQHRDKALANLLDRAGDLPRQAPGKRTGNSSAFFAGDKLQVEELAKAVDKQSRCALIPGQRIAVYVDGAYRIDREHFLSVVAGLLRNDFRPAHRAAVEEYLVGVARRQNMVLPERLSEPLLNVRNGLVDLRTGEKRDHSPKIPSSIQFPVTFDPEATCPRFDAWAKETVGDQLDVLLEVSSAMLDPSRTPVRSLFLYGPSRSGKGTYNRILKAIAGKENTSSVTLHELSTDRFAAATVYGMALNAAGDLPATHIEDISAFKMLTGEDQIRANPKYGKDFNFTAHALFSFAGNSIPSIGETSRAYFARMVPVRFANSFEGHEDDSIEQAMMRELPGILNRLIAAYRARRERGHDLNVNPAIRQEFEHASDRVAQWVAEEMVHLREFDGKRVEEGMQLPAEALDWTSDAKSLRGLFNVWAGENGFHEIGRNTLIQRLTSKNGVVRVRVGPTRKERFAIRKRREGEDPEVPEASGPFPATLNFSEKGEGGESQMREVGAEASEPPDPPKSLRASL